MNCLQPILIKNPHKYLQPGETGYIYVPCGKCIACRSSKAKEWALRCFHELDSWKGVGSFVTLTYDDDEIPLNVNDYGECFETLRKSDLQKFFKRLRKVLPYPIKMFSCGEYGTETFRPHYHCIIFGLSPADEKYVRKCWKSPIVTVDPISVADINYVCGYVKDKIKNVFPEGFFDYREPLFQVFSKGIGLDYCKKNSKQIIQNKYITLHGKKNSIPRYYVKKLDLTFPSDNKDTVQEKLRLQQVMIDSIHQRELNYQSRRNLYKKDKI